LEEGFEFISSEINDNYVGSFCCLPSPNIQPSDKFS
jgi:hypothetical protein